MCRVSMFLNLYRIQKLFTINIHNTKIIYNKYLQYKKYLHYKNFLPEIIPLRKLFTIQHEIIR